MSVNVLHVRSHINKCVSYNEVNIREIKLKLKIQSRKKMCKTKYINVKIDKHIQTDTNTHKAFQMSYDKYYVLRTDYVKKKYSRKCRQFINLKRYQLILLIYRLCVPIYTYL